MEFTIAFLKLFGWIVYLISPLLLLLCAVVVALGVVVGRIESWNRFDAVYWAFITALTVGYGDIRPKERRSRVLAILIALMGILLTGLFVAAAVQSAAVAFKAVVKPDVIERIEREIEHTP